MLGLACVMSDPPAPTPAPAGAGNVTRVTSGGKELFIVGAAHVSRQSVLEVQRVVEELRPNSVCVELDAARLETLTDESRWDRLDVRDTIRKDRAGLFAASLMFSGFQRRLGDRLGVRPGSEMLAAIEAARKVDAEVVLADRDIQATLLRCYRSLGTLDRAKVSAVLAVLPFAAGDIDEAEVEQLKDQRAMGDVMETFAAQMPALKVPLIDERDQYLIARIREAPGPRVVAVVGAAHVPGMVRALAAPVDCEALSVLPPPDSLDRAKALVLPLVCSALLLAGAAQGVLPAVICALATPVALVSLLLGLAAGTSTVGVLLGTLLAPLSLLLPGAPIARYLGLREVDAHPPLPGEGQSVRDDVLSPQRARRNRVLRPVLVVLAFTLSRSVGGFAGVAWALLRVVRGG